MPMFGECFNPFFSKLPIRQLIRLVSRQAGIEISKLPIRQLIEQSVDPFWGQFSKLPIRQLILLVT